MYVFAPESCVQMPGTAVTVVSGRRDHRAVTLREKLNILSFALASDARDSHHGYIRPWECPPPPPALLTQDSMPRERRHLAGVTWEGGLVVLSFLLSGECSLDATGLLRFRTGDVLLGTSGVGVCGEFPRFFNFYLLFLAI